MCIVFLQKVILRSRRDVASVICFRDVCFSRAMFRTSALEQASVEGTVKKHIEPVANSRESQRSTTKCKFLFVII